MLAHQVGGAVSWTDLIIIAMLVTVIVVSGWLVVRAERREARRRARWHYDYFHRGGLVRSLMKRWRSAPKLTDRTRDERR